MPENQKAFKYADLIVRYLKNELNNQELATLQAWLQSDPGNQGLFESIKNKELAERELHFFTSIDTDAAWRNILAVRKPKPFYQSIFSWKYAAAAMLAGCAVSALYFKSDSNPSRVNVNAINKSPDIKPGGDKATLTLADGSVVQLDGEGSGLVANGGGVRVTKKDGRLVYEILNSAADASKASFNTITTPRGGQYQVVLPDGSSVWLNASSSMRFPTLFRGAERLVSLNGEAYFEVSKNRSMPFRVMANGAEIKVLGTHFNVRAYTEESEINTTLLEGSVKVIKGKNNTLIMPGQQALTARSSETIKVSDADVEEAIAWKNGVFLFNNEDITMIMHQLERWYNVRVEYRDKIPDMHFTGKISRHSNVSKVLNLLELTGEIHFTIENNKILVHR